MAKSLVLKIVGLSDLGAAVGQFVPHAVISIGTGTEAREAYLAMRGHEGPICRLDFADIHPPTGRPPNLGDMARVADFVLEAFRDGRDRLLLHCGAGISRSPAIGLFALAFHDLHIGGQSASPERARDLVRTLFEIAPLALPHPGIVAFTDALLPEYGGAFSRLIRERTAHQGLVMPREGRALLSVSPPLLH